MKKLLFFLVLLSFSKIQAQTYFGFPDSNAVWNVNYSDIGGVFPENPIFIYGDTLIGGRTYKKVYQSEDSFPNPLNARYKAAVRDSNQQWFFVFSWDSNETLAYDFNLNTGDTITLDYNDVTLRVNEVDSIFLAGQYRKRMKMSFIYDLSGFSYEDWIVGIGSTFGLLDPGLSIVCAGHQLTCFHQDEVLIYTSMPDSNCRYSYVGTNKFESGTGLKIYPNPAKDKIMLKFDENCENCSAQLFDIMGRQQSAPKQFNSNEVEIKREELKSGIYYMRIESASGYWLERIVWE